MSMFCPSHTIYPKKYNDFEQSSRLARTSLLLTKSNTAPGFSPRLLDAVATMGMIVSCGRRSVLDTALDNVVPHGFYCRQGYWRGALRFSREIATR